MESRVDFNTSIAHDLKIFSVTTLGLIKTSFSVLQHTLKAQWQTIEIDRIGSKTQETEFSQIANLLSLIIQAYPVNSPVHPLDRKK